VNEELQEAITDLGSSMKDFRARMETRQAELEARVNRMNLGTAGAGKLGSSPEPQDRGFFLQAERIASAAPAYRLGELVRAAVTGKATTEVRNVLLEGGSVGGGYLVPESTVSVVIDAMRDALVCQKAGCKFVTMTEPGLAYPRVDTPPTATWTGENSAATEASMAFGRVDLRARKLVALIRASRELIDDAPAFPTLIDQLFSQALASGFDSAALIGSGKGETPLGIANTPGIGVKDLSAALTLDDILEAYYSLLGENVPEDSVSCVMNSLVAKKMGLLKSDATTDKYLLSEAPPKEFERIKFFVTNAIPTASNKSTIIMGDFSRLVLGVRLDGILEISPAAVIAGESTFERSQIAIRGTLRGDVAVEDPHAFGIITSVPTN